MALTLIVAYDISDDRRRSRLAAVLQTWGDRIQYSVFLLTVSDEDLADIRTRATAIIDPTEDSVYFAHQCRTCWDNLDCLGQAFPPSPELCWLAL